MVVAAMNPCPCGYYGDPTRKCTCSEQKIKRYLNRISGPLLDRFDIHVEVPAVKFEELRDASSAECSADIKREPTEQEKFSVKDLRAVKQPATQN